MAKTLTNEPITYVDGKPFRIVKTDDDGEPVRIGGSDDKPEYEMVAATTKDVLQLVMFRIPESVQSHNDPMRVHQLWNQLDRVNGDATIVLKDKTYDWLHKVLNREVPVTHEAKERGVKPRKYSMLLFSMSASHIINQLKDEDEKKTPEQIDEEADDD